MSERTSAANMARFSRTSDRLRHLTAAETRAAVRTLIGAGVAEVAVARLLGWGVNDVRRAATPELMQ